MQYMNGFKYVILLPVLELLPKEFNKFIIFILFNNIYLIKTIVIQFYVYGSWIVGYLRPSASGGPTGSMTSGLAGAPKVFPLMDAATVIRRFSPRVRGPALAGGGPPHFR